MRRAQPHDVDALLTIAERVYPQFNRQEARAWALQAMTLPDVAVLIEGGTCIIASITRAFWGGPRRCYLLFLFGAPTRKRGWEALRLLRAVDAWRKERGAESFHFGEDTGLDFSPLAKRLGAKLDRPSWKIEGGQKHLDIEPSTTLKLALAGVGRMSALEQAMRI